MKYNKELSEIIKQSNLSLRDIASRCQALGVPLSHSYLSQLQSGKYPPPAAKVTEAICKVCDVSAEGLILQGYIEKAPDIVQYYFSECNHTVREIVGLLQTSKIEFFPNVNLDIYNDLQALTYTMSRGAKLSLAVKKSENITERAKGFKSLFKTGTTTYYMEDNSMESLIPKNAQLEVSGFKSKDNMPKNNDIIICHTIDETSIVRRYQKNGETIFLKPENNKYDIIQINKGDYFEARAKVIAYNASVN